LVHEFLHCCTGWAEEEVSFPSAPSPLCKFSEATVQHLHLGRRRQFAMHMHFE